VKHDKVVSLDERVEDLINRYGINEEKREALRQDKNFMQALEKKIVSFMSVSMETALAAL
jgi:hypothetical protein